MEIDYKYQELRTKLSEREYKFCIAYRRFGVISKAAIEAGYSKKTAKVIGWQVIQKEHVKVFLEYIGDKDLLTLETSLVDIAHQFKSIACVSVADLLDENGKYIAIDKLPAHVSNAIAEITFDGKNGDISKIKMHDKLRAFERFANIMGLEAPKQLEVKTNIVPYTTMTEEQLRALKNESE